MVNLFEYVLKDLKDGIDSLVSLYDRSSTNTRSASIVWGPTSDSMKRIYNLKN